MTDALLGYLLVSAVFSLGFVAGCWWRSRGHQ
jgi:hypothetical protein